MRSRLALVGAVVLTVMFTGSLACDSASVQTAHAGVTPPNTPLVRTSFVEVAMSSATSGATHDTAGVTPEAVAKGRAVFRGAGTCAVCHGQALEGGVGPALRAHAWKDAKGGELPAILAVVQHGVPGTAMTAHPGGINDVQAMQVASYVWAVSHDHAKP